MSSDPSLSDDLTTIHVRQAVAGDNNSQEWIVEHFTPLLLAQARFRLRGDLGKLCDPADIVNEVWLRVLPKLHQLTPEQRYTPTLVSYLSRAVILQINNLMRRMIRRRARGGDLPHGDASPFDAADQRSGVVSMIARGERRDAVHTAIEALAEADRDVIVLRAIEQQSNQAAAEILGIEPGTLAVRYHRAMKQLKKQLPSSIFDEFADGESSR